jgi:hypothetical protein
MPEQDMSALVCHISMTPTIYENPKTKGQNTTSATAKEAVNILPYKLSDADNDGHDFQPLSKQVCKTHVNSIAADDSLCLHVLANLTQDN